MGNDFPSRVLVTGGAGFIGRRVVAALLAEGAEVTVADLKTYTGDDSVRVVTGDLVEPSVADQAVAPGTDTIIHLAARTSVLESLQDPEAYYRNNVALTAGLLELARQRGVGTFLFASTNAVVGNVGQTLITEQAPLRPLTPYGATKAASEMLISSYSAAYGVRGVSLRFSNVYGPGMEHKDSFIPRLMKAARDGTGVKVRGDGSMIRDVIQVDDVISGMFAAWRSDPQRPGHPGLGPVGDGERNGGDGPPGDRGRHPGRERPDPAGRDARGQAGHLGVPQPGLLPHLRLGKRHGDGVAGLRPQPDAGGGGG